MNRRVLRRRVLRRIATLAVIGGLLGSLVACGGDDDGPMTWDARSLQGTVEGLPFIPSVINSGLGVGENRVVVALIDRADGALVGDATVTATFYRLANNPDAEPEVSEAVTQATRMTPRMLDLDVESGSASAIQGLPTGVSMHSIALMPADAHRVESAAHDGEDHAMTTVYTTHVAFDHFGYWGLALRIEAGGQTHHTRMKFWVMEHQGEVAIGAPAPRSEQLTLQDVGDAADVSSATKPNAAMLDRTVAEALDTGRPVVVAFVTPAFCQTRFCGPVLEAVVEPAWEQYGDRVEFVHIEPFDLNLARAQGALQPVPSVMEWGIRTEPFIFVVDAEGLVQHKLEGITDLAELSEAIEDVLAPRS